MLPDRSLLVCANQRTGSTMLCRALTSTQVAGRPDEYFLTVDPVQFPQLRCWGDGSDMSYTDYLHSVYRQGTTENGVFAAKMMWNYVDLAAEAFQRVDGFAGLDRVGVFQRAFPSLRAVVLTRRDRLAQAVSWARAVQEDVWVVPAGNQVERPLGPPVYDGELIGNLLRLIDWFEPLWPSFLDELEVPYIRLVYEDIIADLPGTVRQVCELLDVEVNDDMFASIRPSTARQADGLNDEWTQRFRADNT
jgi:LPS sulfotransferase NodH